MLCFQFTTLLWLLLHVAALADPEVFMTLPSTLYVEHDNLVTIRATQSIATAQLITSIPSLNDTIVDIQQLNLSKVYDDGLYGEDILYKAPFVPVAQRSITIRLNLTVSYCENPECTSNTVKHLTKEPTLARRSIVILGETDKPIYRPGETVRFRFLTLTPQFTVPLNSSVKYPDRGLVRSAADDGLVIETLSTAEVLTRVVYDEIYIQDDKGTRLHRWLNVTPAEAASLSYPLIADAREGEWSVNAHVMDETERLTFTVRHFVLPRFVLKISPPNNFTFESNFTEYSVCANYTNGPPMIGTVKSYLCVCPGLDTSSSFAKDIMITGSCPTNSRSRASRPCVHADDILTKDGCVNFNVTTNKLDLKSKEYPKWGQNVMVCAEVEEEGTGSNLTRCEVGNRVERKKTTMEITAPSVYKPGLPISIGLQIKGPFLPDAVITVKCTERWDSCFQPRPSEARTGAYAYITKVKPNSSGFAQIILPSPSTSKGISIKATYLRQNYTRTNIRRRRWIRLPPWGDDDLGHEIVAYAYLSSWKSVSSTSMQVWPNENAFELKPSGLISLNLIANTPLANKTLIIQTMVRGKLLKHIIEPMTGVREPCEDRDDSLGHYKCLSNDTNEIECAVGWQGKDCLQAICANGCHPQGGVCALPDECNCLQGWTGASCEICVKRKGCQHGQCVKGDDCVCEQGWQGYLCDRVDVRHEAILEEEPEPIVTEGFQTTELTDNSSTSTETVPKSMLHRRTLYQRNISFPIDGNWGPKATVIIYFYENRESILDIIPAIVQLTNLDNFTSPSIAEASQRVESGIQFDSTRVNPGQMVQLILTPTGVDTNMLKPDVYDNKTLSDQVCFVRLYDVALDNFEGPKNLMDLKDYTEAIEQLDSANSWRPTTAEDVKEAFQAAGFYHASLMANERIWPNIVACPFMAMARGSNMVDADSEALGMPQPSPLEAVSKVHQVKKPRLRDFFPEVWLFEALPIGLFNSSTGESTVGIQKNLTAPDSITRWRASAFCTTKSNGMWISNPSQLTVSMPFYIQLTLPKQVKRGEILYLPVSVFVTQEVANDSSRKQCYEVQVTTLVDEADWLRVGVHDYTGCVCPGEKQTFQLGLIPQRLGQLNVTAEAYANADSALCGGDDAFQPKGKILSDMVRRQIRVIPEGVAKETTVGDILCLPSGVDHVNLTTPIFIPETIIPDSLRIYLTYTDEVLGPALRNLDNLVRLPTGCGEQNMVLIAPNVYVLEYLMHGIRVKNKETEKLIHRARMHIMTGYRGQLKYRLSDGSYSAFGQSDKVGSTWLTAFVLRVFARAFRVQNSLNIAWDSLFNETYTFLRKQQDLDGSGCFVEKGRVLHSAMQGGLGETKKSNQALLTAYILSALSELRHVSDVIDYETFNPIITNGIRCIKAGVPRNILLPEPLSKASTYGLAQVAYVLELYQPDTYETELYIEELLRRQKQVTDPVRGTYSYWPARNQSENVESSSWANALDVETTSYAYLALIQPWNAPVDAFSIVRWLSMQQTATGGFRSTQDTVLALQVITNAARRLNQNGTNPENTDIRLSATIIPSGHTFEDVITNEKRQVINQIAIPYTDPTDLREVRWEVKTEATSARHCVALQTALFYNVPHPDSDTDSLFTLTATVMQSNPPPMNACTTARLTTCVRLAPHATVLQETGMLLVRVEMVSGWQPIQEELAKLVGTDDDSVRRADLDDKGTVSLYFNGFTATEAKQLGGWDRLKRCAQLNLKQTTYVDSSQPATISAMDYYATERVVTQNYQLATCKSAWLTDEKPPEDGNASTVTTDNPVSTVTPAPPVCPKCQLDKDLNPSLTDNVYDWFCNGYQNMFMINVYASNTEVVNVTMIVISTKGYASTWNATLNPGSCSCTNLLSTGSKLIWLASHSFDVSLGQPNVTLITPSPDAILLPVKDVLPHLHQAQQRFESKTGTGETNLYSCKRIKPTIIYIEKKLLSTS